MPARSRSFERAPSAATSRLAAIVAPSASVTSMPSARASKLFTAVARSSTPAASARAANASIRWRFSTMCAKGSPGSTSPPNVRNTGRVASLSAESVTTMSRIGCAVGATSAQTPSASNRRRQAATMAVARGSRLGRWPSAGSATMTGISGPSPWRSASASASPAKAPPQMTMLRCADIPLTHTLAP